MAGTFGRADRRLRSAEYIVLTQDLDFSAIVALPGATKPSVVSLRLVSSRIEIVNNRLGIVPLSVIEADAVAGTVIARLVGDARGIIASAPRARGLPHRQRFGGCSDGT